MIINPDHRPLAVFLPSVPGESFNSYVNRLAAEHDVPLVTMLARTGIIDEELIRRIEVAYGIVMPEKRLKTFAYVTGLETDLVRKMFLSSYDGVAIDIAGLDANSPVSCSCFGMREWVYFSGSHICPHCIAENGGAWLLSWKLPWSFACITHKLLLIDACPQCSLQPGFGRDKSGTMPCFASNVPKPKLCMNAQPSRGPSYRGYQTGPCGYDLTKITACDLSSWPSFLEAQKAVNDGLTSKECMAAGEIISNKIYFQSLRSLAALVLCIAQPEDFPPMPDAISKPLFQYIENRDAQRMRRREAKLGRGGCFQHFYLCPPRNAGLMAAVTTAAHRMLDTSSREELSDHLDIFVSRLKRTRKYYWSFPRSFNFPEYIHWAFSRCFVSSNFDRRVGRRSILNQVGIGRFYSYLPANVPQLLWNDDYVRSFAELLPGVDHRFGRRVCSMALVKLCGNYTWEEAAEKLDLPARSGNGMANKVMGILFKSGQIDAFGSALHDLAFRLSQCDIRVDYQRRRQCLATFEKISDEEWVELCLENGVRWYKPGSQNFYSAVWVWSFVTEGDWTLSPTILSGFVKSCRAVYPRFVKKQIPYLEKVLMKYSESLIKKLNL